MVGWSCRIVLVLFAILYACGLGVLAIGTVGLFGVTPDPLSGIYVIVLGLPWVLFADGAPEVLTPWLAAAAPLVNLAILLALCRLAGRASRRRPGRLPSSR